MSFPVLVPLARQNALPDWVGPVVFAAVLQAALMVGYMARFGGDPSVFVCAPSGSVGEYPFEHVHASLSKEGHDGQSYYVIARSPFQRQEERYVSPPCYRHVRILYPALAWAASGGDPKRLLWAMPAINCLAVVGLAGLGAVFALRFGRSPWWGLLLPVVLNAATPALRDFTDPLAMFCAFALLAAWLLRGGTVVLTLAAVAAALSREQNVAIVGIVLMAALWQRKWGAAAGLVLALAVWGAWVGYLKQMYGMWPYGAENMSAPFAGMLYRLEHLRGDHAARSAPIHAAGLAYIVLQIAIAAIMPILRAEKTATLTAWAGAALAIFGGAAIYIDGHSYTRVFVFLPLGIWLWTVHSGRSWPVLLLSPALLWPCYALFQVWRR